MLRECLLYLTSPCPLFPRYVRSFYLKGLIGITSRYHRQRQAWRPHLQASQQAIKSFIEQNSIAPRGTVIILGSGPLLDVPLGFLNKHFKRVYLIDIVHLISTRIKCLFYPHAKMRSLNLVGAELDFITQLAGPQKCSLANHPALKDNSTWIQELTALPLPDLPPADCIISLNLLSQLAIFPYLRLEEILQNLRCPQNTRLQRLTALCNVINGRHLKLLRSYPQALLISEITQQHFKEKASYIQRTDETILSAELLAQLSPWGPNWDWHLAPYGEIDRQVEIISKVGAFTLSSPPIRRP